MHLDCSHGPPLTTAIIQMISIYPLSWQPYPAEPIPCNSTWGCSNTTSPKRMAWQSTRGARQRAQPHFYGWKTCLLWLCIQQQPQLLQIKLNLSCKCNTIAPQRCRSQLTALLDAQNPPLELDQTIRAMWYLKGKCGRWLPSGRWSPRSWGLAGLFHSL